MGIEKHNGIDAGDIVFIPGVGNGSKHGNGGDHMVATSDVDGINVYVEPFCLYFSWSSVESRGIKRV